MWRETLVLLATVVGVALSFDRDMAREKLVDYRVRSQNLHIDHLDGELEKMEKKFEDLGEPVGMWDIRMLAAHLRRTEGRKCHHDHEVTCGGDYPECIGNLLVCDGHVDCHNGRDEDPRVCNADHVSVGSTYQGVIQWESCVAHIDHNMIITITAVHRPDFFRNRLFLRATVTSDNEKIGDPERIHFYSTKGYYVFATRQLVLVPDEGAHSGLGIVCSFHFGDTDYTDCVVKQVLSMHECGHFRAIRA